MKWAKPNEFLIKIQPGSSNQVSQPKLKSELFFDSVLYFFLKSKYVAYLKLLRHNHNDFGKPSAVGWMILLFERSMDFIEIKDKVLTFKINLSL